MKKNTETTVENRIEDNEKVVEQTETVDTAQTDTEETHHASTVEEESVKAPESGDAVSARADGDKKDVKPKKPTVEEAMETLNERKIEAPKKRKYGWVGTLVLLGVIAVGIWLMFRMASETGDAKSLGEVLAQSDYRFALAAVVVLLIILACDCMKYAVVMKTTTSKFNLRASIKVSFLGKFYDNITPFAAGGQPMQIYYLHKKGYSGGVSSAVVLIKYFAQMFSWTLVSLLLMACNTGVLDRLDDPTWATLIRVAAWIGLGINMLLPVAIVLFALLPRVARKLAGWVVSLGAKIKIVKDKEKTLQKTEGFISDFRAAFAIMSHKPLNFIALLLLCIVEVFFTFSLPYFVMRAFNALNTDAGITVMFAVMALNVYAAQAVTVIPTPGNSGAMEGVVTKAFSAIVSTAVLGWAVFTWRFFAYYIYIVVGIGITVFEFIRSIYRRRKASKGGTGEKP